MMWICKMLCRAEVFPLARLFSLLVAMAYLPPCHTVALTIDLTFNSASSDSPNFDLTGALLEPVIQAAADHWEDIIQDAGTLEIEYYYDNLADGKLATHNNLATSSGKPTKAKIRFDTQKNGVERNWYFDPTPTNHSEYNLQQTLYRDLDADDQTDWFNGSPPDLLEVGYRGNLSTTAPVEAVGAYDIFSTAIHEIGHAVGLTSRVSSGEYADDDYDVPTNLVGGAVMAIEGDAHIAPRLALMCSNCGSKERRRIPTAVDIFAAATGAGWTNLDLYRQDMWSTGNMNHPFRWEGNAVPSTGDDASVRHQGTGSMTDDLHVQNLTIAEGSSVKTGNHTLKIDHTTLIQRNSSAITQLLVESGGTLMTKDLRLLGAQIDMAGGVAQISDFFEVQPHGENTTSWAGEITGNGVINIDNQLENNGIIRPRDGALTFRSISVAAWDLDGDGETGELDASNGNLIFDSGGLRDSHDGQITIGDDHFVRFDFDWELGSGGIIDLNGTNTKSAELLGPGTATITGHVNATGRSSLDSSLVFNPAADISLEDVDTLLTLGKQVDDWIIYHGGSFTGLGELEQNGNATVTSGSTVNISVAHFNFDGTSNSSTTIETGATMNITSEILTDSYSGNLTVQGMFNMDLVTSTSWSLGGSLVVNGGGAVHGNELRLTGKLTTASGGEGTVNASLDIQPHATLEVNAVDDTLNLNGSTTWSSPTSVTGLGQIIQNGDAQFVTNTTISVDTYDLDGTDESVITINPNVTLTLDVQTIDTGTDGFNGTLNLNSGTIIVNTIDAWSMEGMAKMDTTVGSPKISGSQIVITDTLNVIGEGIAHIDANTIMETGANVIVAANTKLELNGTNFLKGGSFNTGRATASEPPSRVELDGFTNYDGGTITVLGVLRQDGNAVVNAATTIVGDYFDMDGSAGVSSEWNINDNLTLNVQGIEDRTTNNTFHGSININSPDGSLTVNTTDFWAMDGTLQISSSTTQASPSVAGQNFTLSGQANIDGAADFDAIVQITGKIDLLTSTSTISLLGGDLVDTNTIHGGTITGAANSQLRTTTGHALVGNGVISTHVDFLHGSMLLADNGTLTIDGSFIALGLIGTNDDDGILNIVNSWDTGIADQLWLDGGTVTGGRIINGGLTTGYGKITANGFDNVGTLSAVGGTLMLNTTVLPDLDGMLDTGVINALSGHVHISTVGGSSTFLGTLNIAGGHAFHMPSHGLDNRGVIQMTGGTLAVTSLQQDGQLVVNSGTASTLSSPDTRFTVSSNNLIDDDLHIDGVAQIHPGANFLGSGRFIANDGSEIHLQNGSSINIQVLNHGKFKFFPSSPGTAKIASYEQSSSGQWEVEFAGTNSTTEHDTLQIGEIAALEGLLALQPLTPYVDPIVRGMSDEFTILRAGRVVGNFAAVEYGGVPLTPTFVAANGSLRSHQGNGLFRNVTYETTRVVIQNLMALEGDADGDFDIDITDFNILASNFDDSGTNIDINNWTTADFDMDGDVDITDFNFLAENLSDVGYGRPVFREIPEPRSWVLWVFGGLSMFWARKQRVGYETSIDTQVGHKENDSSKIQPGAPLV